MRCGDRVGADWCGLVRVGRSSSREMRLGKLGCRRSRRSRGSRRSGRSGRSRRGRVNEFDLNFDLNFEEEKNSQDAVSLVSGIGLCSYLGSW